MILFFGTKTGKQTTQTLNDVSCIHCSQKGTIKVVNQPNYFHLFWISLFKIGTSRFAECSHCKRVYYKEEFNVEMTKAIE